MHHHKYRVIIPFLLPAILLYGVFVVWPYVQAILVSLTSWRGVSGNRPFVGLENYQQLATDNRFVEDLLRNGQILIALPLITIAVALVFASLMTQGGSPIKGAGVYRVVFFFPYLIPAVVTGILWSYVYTPNIGLLNGVLGAVGLGGLQRSWLVDPGTTLPAIVGVAIWSSIGFYMVIFIASMQSIPSSFYEAAVLDGATRWTTFKDITFPLIWETVRTSVIYLAIAALDFFVYVITLSGGSTTTTARKAEVAAVYLYNQAFDKSRWGYASAIGVVLLVLTLVLSVGIMRATRRETYEF